MNNMRARAKEHFPTVLLTLLSIVQALALELLWGHIVETDNLYALTWAAALSWVQVSATFLGIILVWVVYASNVTRFSWVPSTSDSVLPFLIGVLEFLMVETLCPERIGPWLILMAAIFAGMNWITHSTMRRARQDEDNKTFFTNLQPARLSDFYTEIVIITCLCAAGIYEWSVGTQSGFAMAALLATVGLLTWQYRLSAMFWERSVAAD